MIAEIVVVASASIAVAFLAGHAAVERAKVWSARDVKLAEMQHAKLTDAAAEELRASIMRIEEQVKSIKTRDIAKQLGRG